MAFQRTDENGFESIIEFLNSSKALQSNRVDLSRRALTQIPNELLGLDKVEYLYLEGNLIKEIPEYFFESLSSLKWLDLRNNQLQQIPESIGKHRALRSLLLDGNNLKTLPIELGMVKSITGIHLADNPLEFPPKDIIDKGTQEILKFLRSQIPFEEVSKPPVVKEEKPVASPFKTKHDIQIKVKPPLLESRVRRRHSYPMTEETPVLCMTGEALTLKLAARMTASQRARRYYRNWSYDHISPVSKENAVPFAPGGNTVRFVSAQSRINGDVLRRTKNNQTFPANDRKSYHKEANDHGSTRQGFNGSGYLRRQSVESKMQEEMRNLRQKIENEKTDAILQKRKNVQAREDWKAEAKRIQRHKQSLARMRGLDYKSLEAPFGTENQREKAAISKHAQQVKAALESADNREERQYDDIVDSIHKHISNMNEVQEKEEEVSVEEGVERARRNLEEALRLQKKLEERRALEYRLRAFTGGDFFPPKHAKAKQEWTPK